MVELETILLIAFVIILFIFFLIYAMMTIGNKHIRTLLIASIPRLRGNRVLDIHLLKNRTVNLQLVESKGSKLEKHGKEDGVEFTKNKLAEAGTNFTEPTTNTQIFFTMDGLDKTFDPTKSPTMSEMDEITVEQAFNAGQSYRDYIIDMVKPKELKGTALIAVVALGIIFLAFVVGMLYQVNANQLAIIEAVT